MNLEAVNGCCRTGEGTVGKNDPGAESPAYSWGVIGAIGAAGAISPGVASELFTELSSFTKFRDRIDGLLRDLKASPADAKKLGEVAIGETQFGDPAWAEASGLYSSYQNVITELETLSKLLSDSIEGLGIAVLAAHTGYENLDDDIRDRMLAIKRGAEEHYEGEYNPVPNEGKQGGGQPTTTPQPSPTKETGSA
ncbi:hypothetical protein OG978_15885 [Streptomyces sp. NBC_01591]|uniref:hypothetical protein n=1 Tax=Streptomyces sp. NBC_01591 TaxID=2975888 RepID=UPI002DD90987|nr:hypothetical protein [Streptomyces sp. NBC_01591]WSD68751.1 hypothetical protein OG978_15885 [Streptomyces sp. NBC_01591]